MHIPPDRILPQDQIDVTDLGPPDPGEPPGGKADDKDWLAKKAEREAFVVGGSVPMVMRMHIVDAKHAMDVEPERYVLASRLPKPEPEQEPEDQVTGADGPAWYPPTQEKPVV